MRVLVVLNYENTAIGQLGPALAEVGGEIDMNLPYLGEALPPNADAHDAMILLGGGQNALADDQYPYFPELLELIRDFARKDRAVLGICLGGQLIARAFGATNTIGTTTEFGWHHVSRTQQGRTDAVLGSLPDRFSTFEWHDDTFSLPPDAVRLATNNVAENQAFRIGRAVYGFQFHFEADRVVVRDWSGIFAALIAQKHPDWADRLDDETARNAPSADAAGLALARAWVAVI